MVVSISGADRKWDMSVWFRARYHFLWGGGRDNFSLALGGIERRVRGFPQGSRWLWIAWDCGGSGCI